MPVHNLSAPYLDECLSARSHGASATATATTIMGVSDTCHTKWVQDTLTATGSANTNCRSRSFEHQLWQSHHVVPYIDLYAVEPIFDAVFSGRRSV